MGFIKVKSFQSLPVPGPPTFDPNLIRDVGCDWFSSGSQFGVHFRKLREGSLPWAHRSWALERVWSPKGRAPRPSKVVAPFGLRGRNRDL